MNATRQPTSWYLFLLTLISRIPFLFSGYGREEDAWSQVLNARLIYETGVYEVSRLPGHPVYELLLALLWPINHQYWFYNGLSAIASAFTVIIFYRILINLKIQSPFWLSLCFSFIPIFFTSGTYTIDYNFALLFILWSWLSLQEGKIWFAAVFIGIATGFRISSIAFILPLAIAAKLIDRKVLLRYWSLSIIVAIICFAPALHRYGLGFLDFHKPPFPGWPSIIYKLTIGVWGIPLLLAFIVLKTQWLRQGLTFSLISSNSEFKRLIYAAIISWVLCLIVFARLPFKAEFFIPSLAFLMVLIGYLGSKKQIQLLTVTSILSCFTLGFDYANPYRGATPTDVSFNFTVGTKPLFFDPLQGPALIDFSKRKNKSALVDASLDWATLQTDSCLLIAGWYWPELEVKKPIGLKVSFDYYSTEEEVLKYHENGYSVYYLPEINESNHLINAHYLADSLGQVQDPL